MEISYICEVFHCFCLTFSWLINVVKFCIALLPLACNLTKRVLRTLLFVYIAWLFLGVLNLLLIISVLLQHRLWFSSGSFHICQRNPQYQRIDRSTYISSPLKVSEGQSNNCLQFSFFFLRFQVYNFSADSSKFSSQDYV